MNLKNAAALALLSLSTVACEPDQRPEGSSLREVEDDLHPETWGDWMPVGQVPQVDFIAGGQSTMPAPKLPDGEYLILGDGRVFKYTGAGRLPEGAFADGDTVGFEGDRGAPALDADADGLGTAEQAIVWGNDDRQVIDSDATLRSYPTRTVGAILGSPDSLSGGCTGTLIGPRHVVTAAHCLHDGEGNWSWPLYFSPGHKGRGADRKPNGEYRRVVARLARTMDESWDYGLMILEDEARTASLGWMGLAYWNSDASYIGRAITVAGYPGSTRECADSPRADGLCGGYQYTDNCTIREVSAGVLYYDCDTINGQSGSAVRTMLGDAPAVLGIHKRGRNELQRNLGARFNETKINRDLCAWMGDFPSSFANHPCD